MHPALALALRTPATLPMETLAVRSGLAPAMVSAELAAGEREGWRFERTPWGVRAIALPTDLDAAQIAHALAVRVVGRRVRVVSFTDSTNDLARLRLDAGVPEGEVVFAEEQTRGRGRHGRHWSAPRGSSLLCSIHLTPPLSAAQAPILNLAAAVALADTVAALTRVEPAIRWPNDVLVGGRKVAGILLETRAGAAGVGCILGIGLNVAQAVHHFPADLRTPATSLSAASGEPVDRTLAARRLLVELDRRYDQVLARGYDGIVRAWLSRTDLVGRRVVASVEGRSAVGTVVDVCADGSLILQPQSGGPPMALRAETVSELRTADEPTR